MGKLGQWDLNTFSRIEAQTQNKFGVTTLEYDYWQVVMWSILTTSNVF